jgi:hypothetical protein
MSILRGYQVGNLSIIRMEKGHGQKTILILGHFDGNFNFFQKTVSAGAPPDSPDYLDNSQAAANARARPARWRRVRASWRNTRLKSTVMAG